MYTTQLIARRRPCPRQATRQLCHHQPPRPPPPPPYPQATYVLNFLLREDRRIYYVLAQALLSRYIEKNNGVKLSVEEIAFLMTTNNQLREDPVFLKYASVRNGCVSLHIATHGMAICRCTVDHAWRHADGC